MVGTATQQATRLFIGFGVPEQLKDEINHKITHYKPDYRLDPADNWHLTLLFLGQVVGAEQLIELISEPLPQAFVPAVRFTHIGAGLAPGQLWVWGQDAAVLASIREQIADRIKKTGIMAEGLAREFKKFAPHVKVGRKKTGGSGLTADTPIRAGFRPDKAIIYRSVRSEDGIYYTEEGKIDIL